MQQAGGASQEAHPRASLDAVDIGVQPHGTEGIQEELVALSFENPEADRLARELAKTTGESMTEAVLRALRERLQREKARARAPRLAERLREIRERCSRLPVLDPRPADDIIGHDDAGAPR